ncbi:MAG: matrixin family metalloprotease [Betaproteobacteria bacterium]|nr:matrixin family metalloprotease [Betaproteobacteria bacterium]
MLQQNAVTACQSGSTCQNGDVGSITRTTAYTYDNAGRLESETREPNDPTTDHSLKFLTAYDRSNNAFGLIGKKTTTWYDPYLQSNVSKDETTTYDTNTNGRFPSEVRNGIITNGVPQSETHGYDTGTGAHTSLTGPNGLITTWTVDAYGRVNVEHRADTNETRQYRKTCVGDGACPVGAATAEITESYNGANRIAVPQIAYKDNAGHQLSTLTWGFGNHAENRIITEIKYDALGRQSNSYHPRYLDDPAILDQHTDYDDLGRVTKLTTYDEANHPLYATTVYTGLVTTLTNGLNQKRVDTHDGLGRVVQVDSAVGTSSATTTKFSYDPFGNLTQTIDPMLNVIGVSYDTLGRKTQLKDPDLGQIDYFVDARGLTWKQINPVQRAASGQNQFARMEFDLLARMTGRYEPDLESHWVYDTASGKGIGQLAEAFTGPPANKDYDRVHTYDNLGRPLLTTQTLFDGAYSTLTDYDAWGRFKQQTHTRSPNSGGGSTKYFGKRYNAWGQLAQVQRYVPATTSWIVLWQQDAQDAARRPTQNMIGNRLKEARGYDPYTDRMASLTLTTTTAQSNTSPVQESYLYDALGNVKTRTVAWDTTVDHFSEIFGYDDLNRLTSSQVSGLPAQSLTFDASGNITGKSGLGGYHYPTPGGISAVLPHAVSSIDGIGTFTYDADGNLKIGAGRTANWTTFDMPSQITKGGAISCFVYGPDHQRTRQNRGSAGSCDAGNYVVYAGAMEVETVPAPVDNPAAGPQVTVKTYWPNGIGVEIDRPDPQQPTEFNWTHLDRLGSPIAISDVTGALQERLSYDPWGKRRTTDGSGTSDAIDGVTDNRGFTGHEMLDQLDLVHMNGRIYEPLIGRFMSADPFVQDPTNGQSYNRYSYVLNNPTNFTDPTGYMMSLEATMRQKEEDAREQIIASGFYVYNDEDGNRTLVFGTPVFTLSTDGSMTIYAKDSGGASGGLAANPEGTSNGNSPGGVPEKKSDTITVNLVPPAPKSDPNGVAGLMTDSKVYGPWTRQDLKVENNTLVGKATVSCVPPGAPACSYALDGAQLANTSTPDGSINVTFKERTTFFEKSGAADIQFVIVDNLADSKGKPVNGLTSNSGVIKIDSKAPMSTFGHETGHWLGLDHSTNLRSLMYEFWTSERGKSFTPADVKMLLDWYKSK